MNPLDKPGEVFDLALMNPIPTKKGEVCRVSFELEPAAFKMFTSRKTKGSLILAAKACVADDGQSESLDKPVVIKGPHGKASQLLIRSGFFGIKQVWDVLGGDKAYQEWCRTQPCVVSGDMDYSDKYPEGRCVYAHVRRADNSGTGMKPEYSGVPMKNEYHVAYQHQHGEQAAFEEHLLLNNKKQGERNGKQWFNWLATKHLTEWAMGAVKDQLKIDSMTNLDPSLMRQFCFDRKIKQYLPRGYFLE